MENLTVPEVAVRLKCSTKTVYRYLAEGKLRPIKLGYRTVRIAEEDLERFIFRSNPGVKSAGFALGNVLVRDLLPIIGPGPYSPEMMPGIYEAVVATLRNQPASGRMSGCQLYFETTAGTYVAEIKKPKRIGKHTQFITVDNPSAGKL